MKRTLLTCLFTGILTAGAVAAPVSRSAALTSAKKFLSSRGISAQILTPADAPSRSQDRPSDESNSPYHIFNIGTDEGYIVIAGDDCARTVLAYSDSGSLDAADMPEACRYWLQTYTDEITALRSESTDGIRVAADAEAAVYPTQAVAPLLKAKWSQTAPYNAACPVDLTTGKICVTGCVATATAQVMYHYRHPAKAEGSITYKDSKQGIERTFDFSALQPFAWDDMTPTYSETSTEPQRAAVASLMNAVGHATRMQFSSGTSIASHRSAADALVNHFGYDKNIHYYERRLMSDREWVDLITSELYAGRPLIYDGRNPEIGHTFVCDGYDGAGMFHFNWGWSGMSDGYFSLSALNPGQQSTGGSSSGYSHSQVVICHIAPAGQGESVAQEDYLLTIYQLNFRDSRQYYAAADTPSLEVPKSDAHLFFYGFSNFVGKLSVEVCAAVATDDTATVTPLVTASASDIDGGGYAPFSFPLADAQLTDGTHKIAFYYRKNPESAWHKVTTSPDQPSECYVTVNGDKLTLSPVIRKADVSLNTDFNPGRLIAGRAKTWTLDIANAGGIRLEAYAGIALIDSDDNYTFYTEGVLCPVGEKVEVRVYGSMSGIKAGEYQIVPFYSSSKNPDRAGIIPFGRPSKVTVEPSPSLVFTPVGSTFFMMAKDATSLDFSVTNMSAAPWSGTIYAYAGPQGGSLFPGMMTADVTLEANGSGNFTLKADGLQPETGNSTLSLYLDRDREYLITSFPLIVTAGVSSIGSVEADATEISIESGMIHVTSSAPISELRLTDALGRTRASLRPGAHEVSISTEGLAKGIYIVSASADGTAPAVKKIAVR